MIAHAHRRRTFSLFELLILLALFMILLGLLLPAVAKVRMAASRTQSANNLKQIGLACHNHLDATRSFPPGVDDNHFSAAAQLLPYLEYGPLYNRIDFKKSIDDKANAEVRKTVIQLFTNPLDPIKSVSMDYGPTSYLFCAGANADLKDNNGIFYHNSKVGFKDIPDGFSNTLLTVETLRGDSMIKAMDRRRQHVQLKKDALKGLKEDAGVQEWKDDKNIAADRCASWMDGRFLQGTFTGTRKINDERPDVNCGGAGGWSGARSLQTTVNVGMADGSVRAVKDTIKAETWKALATRNGGETIDKEF